MTSHLDLKFLGLPEIVCEGRPIRFATRKALALFAFLVVEPGMHQREHLMAVFWPESAIRLAQPALRNTLARIKHALQIAGSPLILEGDRIAFNTACACVLDLDLVRQFTADPFFAKKVPTAEALLQASRGTFLEGLSLPDAPAFDAWLQVQRALWLRRQNLIFERFSLHQMEHQLLGPALETVTTWLRLDPLDESAYRRLMRLHFLNDDRAAAVAIYQSCCAQLAKELGVGPSPETETILAHIRSGQTLVQNRTSQAVDRKLPLQIPFVGRSAEFQTLVHAFHLARQGSPQVVVVLGESGIGKTRLAEQFLKWAATEGADILRGRAYEIDQQLPPYQAVIGALRERLDRENAPEDLLEDAWLVELTRLLPELRDRYPDLPPALENGHSARERIFEAVARLVQSLSSRRALIWLVDDLHWADQDSLELLHSVAKTCREKYVPVLLLLLVRAEALGRHKPLRERLNHLTLDVPITRVNLAALQAEDMGRLVTALAGAGASGVGDLSAWLLAETAGQPFFLNEALAALDASGALIWDGEAPARTLNPAATLALLKTLAPSGLSPAVRDVVSARLAWLSESAAALLAAAAVLGHPCRFENLCLVAGVDEQGGLNALDDLLFTRMLHETANEARPYTIANDRIRDVVYEGISAARRQIYHRRAVSALTNENAPAAELAYHAVRSVSTNTPA